MSGTGLSVERRDGVTILTLDRPERLNAISHGLLRALHDELDRLARDLRQRVVIIRGAGRAFCAGMDMKDQAAGVRYVDGVGEVQQLYALQEAVGELIVKVRRIPQPVIAAVHGVTVGGGLSLACAADIRIAEPSARFCAAFVRLGASGGDLGSSWLLPRIVGFDRAAELLYTGREIDAAEAERIGLVTRLVGDGEALDAALALADEMLQIAPFSTRMTKSLLNLSRDGASLTEQIEFENRTQILLTRTEDFAEGVRALMERRPAAFTDH